MCLQIPNGDRTAFYCVSFFYESAQERRSQLNVDPIMENNVAY